MNAVPTLGRLLLILHLSAIAKLSAQNGQEGKRGESIAEVPGLHVFKITEDCLHYCQDPVEAERRWKLTKAMSTADVYVLGDETQRFSLTPILKQAVVKTIGGGSKTEPMQFGVDVTASQWTQIDDAMQKKQLFIVYYHFGW